MKKTLLASAIALSIGSATTVQAQTITITQMVLGDVFSASGTVNSNGDGMYLSDPNDNFGGSAWVSDQQSWFDTHSSTLTWSGTGTSGNTGNAYGDFSYTFHLESNQVAAGTFWDWNGNNNIPTLTIYDCPVSGGGACVGDSLPWQHLAPGTKPKFNGTTADNFPISSIVPVPAAAWLFGSGLLGLIGIARRRG